MPLVFLALVLSLGFFIDGAAAAEPLPLQIRGNVVTADVMLNGKGPFRMLIDTGASSCSFSAEVARAIGAKPEFRVIDLTPGSSRLALATGSIEVALGEQVESGVQFYWQESLLAKELGIRVAGVIGQSFLSRFDYTLDYWGKRLFIGERAPRRGKPGVRVAFELDEGRMIIPASNREDGRLRLVLDSGASNLSLWHSNVRPEPGFGGDALTYAGRKGVALGRMNYLALGGHIIPNMDVLIPEDPVRGGVEDGLLPAALFRSVYVSNSQSFVELTR